MKHVNHMDAGARNARLCEMLQGMGLFVLPVYAEDDPTRIDHMQVSAGQPRFCERLASLPIGEGVVARADLQDTNVIDFRRPAHPV